MKPSICHFIFLSLFVLSNLSGQDACKEWNGTFVTEINPQRALTMKILTDAPVQIKHWGNYTILVEVALADHKNQTHTSGHATNGIFFDFEVQYIDNYLELSTAEIRHRLAADFDFDPYDFKFTILIPHYLRVEETDTQIWAVAE